MPDKPLSLEDAANAAKDILEPVEINTGNCSEIEIEELNDAANEAYEILRTALEAREETEQEDEAPCLGIAPAGLIEAATNMVTALKTRYEDGGIGFDNDEAGIALEKALASCKPEKADIWLCITCGHTLNENGSGSHYVGCNGEFKPFIELVAGGG